MNLAATADDVGLVILVLLAAIALPILLMGVLVVLLRLSKLPAGLAPIFGFGVVVVAILVASLILDQHGQRLTGVVAEKREQIELREQGDWLIELDVTIHYLTDGQLPQGEFPSPETATVGLSLPAAIFDRLEQGRPVELRVLPLWRSLALVRLAEGSTGDWINWDIFLWIGGMLIGSVLFWQILRRLNQWHALIIGPLVVLALVIGFSSYRTYQIWQTAEDLSQKPARAQATIVEVTRITRNDPFPCYKRCTRTKLDFDFDVPQQYDIVRMQMAGISDSSLTVLDSADIGGSAWQVGDRVEVAFNTNDPRRVQIIGASHNHHWKNLIGFYGYAVLMIGPVVLLLVLAFRFARRRARP
ncbi:MAG: hypothetical protein OHK0050_18850 [Roseiflexaceae bacterium]